MNTKVNGRRTLGLAVSLAAVLALILPWSLNVQAQSLALAPAAERRVCPAGPPTCGYASLQAAVDAAAPGDVIKVAMGVYTDMHSRPAPAGYNGAATISQVVYLDKAVTIRGGYTTSDWNTPDPAVHPTILNAQGQGRALFITGAGLSPVVEGLRITGGNAADLGGGLNQTDDAGGGAYIHLAPAVIMGNLVTNNTAYRGGGLWLAGSAATLQGNIVYANTAEWAGGGLWLHNSTGVLEANHLRSNTAPYGGGAVLFHSPATLRSNTFTANHATAGEGGGLGLSSSDARLEGNIVADNQAPYTGGGLFVNLSRVELINTVVVDNNALAMGSGVYVEGSTLMLKHTTLARNGAHGDGVGMHVGEWQGSVFSAVTMTNSIVAGHSVAGVFMRQGNTVALDATLWHANTADWATAAGTIDHSHDYYGDPSLAADGYHLTHSSAAIDQGVNAGVTADIDGQSRPHSLGYDLGADEFTGQLPANPRIYLPLLMRTR
jgi:hypothetical protein